MKIYSLITSGIFIFLLIGCHTTRKLNHPEVQRSQNIHSTVILKTEVPSRIIQTKDISAKQVVSFAETLVGVKYAYGSSTKEKGFDCSGFINYVFNHFKISVPRTSKDFTNAGTEIPINESKTGDIILFTGSNANSGVVGHMGIITENKSGEIKFIHATENKGVMISGMNSYFIPRFVKVNRVFSVF